MKIRVWNGMRQSPKTRKHVLKQELAIWMMIFDKGAALSAILCLLNVREVRITKVIGWNESGWPSFSFDSSEGPLWEDDFEEWEENEMGELGIWLREKLIQVRDGGWMDVCEAKGMCECDISVNIKFGEQVETWSLKRGDTVWTCGRGRTGGVYGAMLFLTGCMGKIGSGFKVGYKSIWQAFSRGWEVERLEIIKNPLKYIDVSQKSLFGNGELDLVFSSCSSEALSVGTRSQLVEDFDGLTWFPEVSALKSRWIKAVSNQGYIHACKVRMDCVPSRLNYPGEIFFKDLPVGGEVDFMIKRAIPDYMSWRHPSSVITDLKHAAGSYSQADVQRLSASFVKLRDMLEGRLPFYYTPSVAPDVVISGPTKEDLAAATPSTKVLAKSEASKKRRASTSGAASSQIAKRTRSAMAHSSGSSARPNLFDDNDNDGEESDDDDDGCVKIFLITPIRFAATILVGGNQSGGSVPSAAKVLAPMVLAYPFTSCFPFACSLSLYCFCSAASRGKAIIDDDVDTPSESVGRYQALLVLLLLLNTLPVVLLTGTSSHLLMVLIMLHILRTVLLPVLTRLVARSGTVHISPLLAFLPKSLTDDRLARKMSVLHCLMMSHGGELLDRYRGLVSQVSSLKKQVTDLNDKVSTFDDAFVKAKAKGKEQKKKINGGFQSLVKKFLASDEFSRVQGELLSLAASTGFERGLNMNRTQDQLVADLNKISHFVPGAHDRLVKATPLVATTDYPFLNKNEEWLSAMVDKTDEEMVDVASDKLVEVLVQGVAHPVCEDVNRVESSSLQELGFAFSGSADVVIALSIGKKERGSPILQMFL
ncbi:hypothetical protein Tco_0517371 [Tanacetum coccineum]